MSDEYSLFPNGAKDVDYHLHIPTPGRVQYYRAECLPFVPDEIKTQLRFPKAYAMSQENLRYLDKVREETRAFIQANVKQNYFTGEAEVPFSSSLGETEVLYQASDKVKSMADNGTLKSMHDSCQAISESAESQYISVKDRLENIIDSLTA